MNTWSGTKSRQDQYEVISKDVFENKLAREVTVPREQLNITYTNEDDIRGLVIQKGWNVYL